MELGTGIQNWKLVATHLHRRLRHRIDPLGGRQHNFGKFFILWSLKELQESTGMLE